MVRDCPAERLEKRGANAVRARCNPGAERRGHSNNSSSARLGPTTDGIDGAGSAGMLWSWVHSHESKFNPTEGKMTNEEQVCARLWELLRRNSAFRALARQWVAAASFRQKHALTPEYLDGRRLVPRCV